MLSKRERLTTAQFSHYFKTGRRFHTADLQLIYTPFAQFHGAVVVGKKVYKKAVDRNKMRRQLYALLYRLVKQQNQSGVWIITTKPAAKNSRFDDLAAQIASLVSQLQQKEVQ